MSDEFAAHKIEQEREYERMREVLFKEFSQLDINQDGYISMEELLEFIRTKVSRYLMIVVGGR